MNNNELMLNDNKQKIYSSVKADTVEEKKKIYNALESCDVLLNDIVGTESASSRLLNAIDEFNKNLESIKSLIKKKFSSNFEF